MMQRNEIEKIANDVLKQFEIHNAPFLHIKAICEHEKITIKRANLSLQMDGALSVIQGDKYLFYNPQMVKGRINFTKAHELGHHFLNHQLEAGNMIYCYNQSISEKNKQAIPKIESEANYFATCFLMPMKMILEEYYVIANFLGIDTSRRLYVDNQQCNQRTWLFVYRHFATRFGISKEALAYRLDTLGKISYVV